MSETRDRSTDRGRDEGRGKAEVAAGSRMGLAIVLILTLGFLNVVQWMMHSSRGSASPRRYGEGAPPRDSAGSAAGASAVQGAPDVQTIVLAYAPVQKEITLTGQVSLTELGRADVTVPLNGTILEPLVHVGDRVAAGTSIAVVNSAFGQTSLQLLQKLEADQATVLTAGNTLQAAMSTLGQARSALAQTQTTLSQSRDNLAQARAEMANASNDYRRKKELHEGGVFSQADEDDAHERWLKAKAVLADTTVTVKISKHAVDIAKKNLIPVEENVRLSRYNVAIAEATLERDRAIYTQTGVSGAHLPKGLTPVDIGARSRYSQGASAETAMFYVRAPISGVVTAVNMSKGQAVSSNTVIASIVDTGVVYVDGNAYESDLSTLAVGDNVKALALAYPGEAFTGRVSYLGRQVDPGTRTVTVRSRIKNRKGMLRQGMFVTATVQADRPRKALLVPQEALLTDGEKHYVVIRKPEGGFENRAVKEGVGAQGKVELLEGVKAGEKVVTTGNLLVVPH